MTKRIIRKFMFKVHTWLGLHVALYFGVMFLSGALLVFSDELSVALHPNVWVGSREQMQEASFGTIYDSISKKFPNDTIYLISRPNSPWLADKTYANLPSGKQVVIWTDPRDGKVLDVTNAINFKKVLRDFHDALLIPSRIGYLMVTSTSFLLLTAVITGLLSYRRFWRGYFRAAPPNADSRTRAGARHRLVAVWVAPFLLITGITAAFYFSTGLGFMGSVPHPAPAAKREQLRPANLDGSLIDRAAMKAKQTQPGLRTRIVLLPRKISDGLTFIGDLGYGDKIAGGTAVSIDPETLKSLGTIRSSNKRGNARLKPYIDALHYGQLGGVYTRVLWLVFGLLAAYLMFTAVRVYLARIRLDTAQAPFRAQFTRYLSALGPFKWGYALAFAAVILLLIKRVA